MTLERLISYARRTRLPRRGMRLGLCRSTARRMREKGRGACRLHVCRSTARRMRETKGVEPALLHACHVCLPSARLCVHVRRRSFFPLSPSHQIFTYIRRALNIGKINN
jgi:hypothetical protein